MKRHKVVSSQMSKVGGASTIVFHGHFQTSPPTVIAYRLALVTSTETFPD